MWVGFILYRPLCLNLPAQAHYMPFIHPVFVVCLEDHPTS